MESKEKTLRERQKEEALVRMKELKLMPQVIKEFKDKGTIYYSERQNKYFNAILYWLDNEPKWLKMVKEFEKKSQVLVYHCQLTHMEFGDILSLLYVTKDEEEWDMEREDIKQGYVFVKCIDVCNNDNIEFGYIQVKPSMGGIARIA